MSKPSFSTDFSRESNSVTSEKHTLAPLKLLKRLFLIVFASSATLVSGYSDYIEISFDNLFHYESAYVTTRTFISFGLLFLNEDDEAVSEISASRDEIDSIRIGSMDLRVYLKL
ncbi:unnamed protein product [Cochlearia groenlandica]